MLIERRIWAVTTLIILIKEEEPPREMEKAQPGRQEGKLESVCSGSHVR